VVNGSVQVGEFTRAIEALSRQIADVQTTSRETLDEARKTNGRVNGLERVTAAHGVKLENLERSVFVGGGADDRMAMENKPITRRDLGVAVGAVGLLLAAMRWLPALVSAGRGAP
jgi:hypothetical protein